MIQLTADKVQTDIISFLQGSALLQGLSGNVYRMDEDGYSDRPRDSRKEDVEVIFTTGTPNQIEVGVVTLNIYVADITPFKNGVYAKNGRRVGEIEQMALTWANGLTTALSCYKFKLFETIHTSNEPSIHQHFVVVKLRYEYFSENS